MQTLWHWRLSPEVPQARNEAGTLRLGSQQQYGMEGQRSWKKVDEAQMYGPSLPTGPRLVGDRQDWKILQDSEGILYAYTYDEDDDDNHNDEM